MPELPEVETIRRELDTACEELAEKEILCAAAQAELTLARTQKIEIERLRSEQQGEALRALEEADRDLAKERSKTEKLERKVALLQKALHRDR